jgi:hypothetical protein
MASQNLDSLPNKLSQNESTFGNQAQVTKTIETVGHSPVAEHSPIVQQTPNVAQTTLENKVSSTRSTSETISDTKKNSNRESILAIPNNWGQLVETWKTFRPLQARKLEDVVPLDYSPTLIRIGVRSDSLVGQSLLQKDGMLSLKQELQEIFSFAGELVIETYDGAKIGETLLDVKEREIQDRKDRLKNEALESQLVKHMTKVFDAPVLQVRVADSPQTTK